MNRYQAGVYHPDTNTMSFDTSDMESSGFTRTVLHEFWHAYKTLIHSLYQSPTTFSIERCAELVLPYASNANDALGQRRQIQSAIDLGDNRILNDLPNLQRKDRSPKQKLTKDEQSRLSRYKEAAEQYEPKRAKGGINQTNFQHIRSDLTKAIKHGRIYKYSYTRNGRAFYIYVDAFEKLNDGGAIFYGYTTPDPVNDKLTALIGDMQNRKYSLGHNCHKFGSKNQADDILVEHDAWVAENGPEVNEVFYPERDAFHQDEHQEFLNKYEEGRSIHRSFGA